MILCNAIFRHFAPGYDLVQIPCKAHNRESVAWMLSDVANIEVVSVANDEEADEFSRRRTNTTEYLGLGMFGVPPCDMMKWSSEFYRHAGLDFELRHLGFKFPPAPSPIVAPSWPYAFVHDDPARGFNIDRTGLPAQIQAFKSTPGLTGNIFNYASAVANAEEIHCIDSCFSILADLIPTLASKLVLHAYATIEAKPTGPPIYHKKWEVWK